MAVKTTGKVLVKKGTAKKKTVKKSSKKVPTISKSYAVNKSGQIIAKKKSYVISNGIRKARRKSIRKFADVYRLGIANMGLAELTNRDVNTYNQDAWRVEHTTYKDSVSKPVNGGKIVAYVSLHIYQSTVRSDSNMKYGIDDDFERYYEALAENPNTVYWSDNAVGTMKVEVGGRIGYQYVADSGDKTELCDVEEEGYAVEDVLDALTRDSESAWDEVQNALGPIIEMNSAMPKIIRIPSSLGEVKIGRGVYQSWFGHNTFTDTLQGNTFGVEITVEIRGRLYDSWYSPLDMQEVADCFEVQVEGEFEDYNERPSDNIHDPSPGRWERKYSGQGADTLEGAIAIATSNVAEICQEFTDYLNAEHNYVTQSNGRGYARTTTDQNDWYYNFGDSYDDFNYEQNVMSDTLLDPFTGRRIYSEALSDESSLASLLEEYLGENWRLTDYTYGNNRFELHTKSWCKDEAQDFLLTTELTRDDLERACRMVGGFEVEEYNNPLNFTVRINERIELSTKKSKRGIKMRNNIRKYGLSPWAIFGDIDDLVGDITRMYNAWENDENGRSSTQESKLFNEIDEQMEDLYAKLNSYADELEKLTKSAKKSKYSNIHRSLNKIGGFTKEDDEEEIPRTIGSKKRRVKMRKESDLPEDADDQQEQNIKGSGNAGSDLPEDADDQQDIEDAGSGNAGSLMPEDAENVTRSSKRRKGMRKFSITSGGSPDQTSYIDRYNQAPRVRSAIDSHFSDTQMLQERIDAMGKSRRNSLKNNVPTTLVTTKKRR